MRAAADNRVEPCFGPDGQAPGTRQRRPSRRIGRTDGHFAIDNIIGRTCRSRTAIAAVGSIISPRAHVCAVDIAERNVALAINSTFRAWKITHEASEAILGLVDIGRGPSTQGPLV